MTNEQEKTLEVLRFAVQMEIDGKEYYEKASKAIGNKLGKKLFQSLADEEDLHRQKFEQIYDEIRQKQTWPEISTKHEKTGALKTTFAQAIEELGSNVEVSRTELDAVKKAIAMENKSYDYYQAQAGKAHYNAEKGFYEDLMSQERTHSMVLLDYFEYLENPTAWFVQKEHHSLDGG